MHALAGGRCPRGVAGRPRGGVQGARGSARRWCARCCRARRRRRRPCGSRAIHAGAARQVRRRMASGRTSWLAQGSACMALMRGARRMAPLYAAACALQARTGWHWTGVRPTRLACTCLRRSARSRHAQPRADAAQPPSPPMQSRSWGSQFQRSGARCCCGAGGSGGSQAQCGRRALAAREGVGAARGAAGECIGPPPPQGARACCARKRQGLRVQAVAVPT